MNTTGSFGRRSLLKAGALLGGLSALLSRAVLADAQERNNNGAHEAVADEARMADIPLTLTAKVTVEACSGEGGRSGRGKGGDKHELGQHLTTR